MKLRTLILLAAPWTMAASQIQFVSLPGNTENGTYNGYVGAKVDGVLFNNLICDDYLDITYVPSGPFTYDVGTLGNLATALFATQAGVPLDTAVTRYRAAALVLNDINSDPANVARYQYALWDIFTPAAPSYQNSAQLAADLLAEASAPPGGNAAIYQRLVIYTPSGSRNQEFLQLANASYEQAAVPEPDTRWLAVGATAFFALGLWARRYRGGCL